MQAISGLRKGCEPLAYVTVPKDLTKIKSKMLFGLTKPDDAVSVKPFDLFRRELTIKASYINPYTMGRAVDLINAGRLDVHSMVAQAIPLSGLRDVLADPALRARGKYIVSFG